MNATKQSTGFGLFLFTLFSACILGFVISTLLTIKILTRTTTVDVPDLKHKSVESARSILRVKRLKIDIAEYRFDQRIPTNLILDQDPKAEEKVKSGRLIKVIVSRGSQSVTVPDVRGQSIREATIVLNNTNLNIGRTTRYYTDEAPKHSILDQFPAPASPASRGANINLLVSNGPKPLYFLMPNFSNWHIDEATLTLENLGMELREIKRKEDDTLPTGTILEQTPPTGARVRRGDPAGLISTYRTDDQSLKTRFVTIKYHVPPTKRAVRLKLVVKDATGLREVYSAMEKPNADLVLRKTLYGESALLKVYINGELLEERTI